jgi:ribose 1,5-bisphosphate isomerase
MILKTVPDVANRIKSLEIQGATNIAISAVKALSQELSDFEGSKEDAYQVLTEATRMLVESRSTEPMMRNGLKYIRTKLTAEAPSSRDGFKEVASKIEEQILEMYQGGRQRIMEIGAKRIKDGDIILTHCHSSAVTGTLMLAHEMGKEFKVINTETRPKYQGRITSREMIEAGIDNTMIVDSAARHYMKEVDFVIVGCDALTSEGNIINKIGTSQVALAAYEARIPFYVLGTLLKFEPITIRGHYEAIEERNTDEIWADPPEGLKIRNPAFDVTRRDYVSGLISEEGIISPHSILEAIHRHYPWILG